MENTNQPIDEKKKPNAYRVIPAELLQLYLESPDKIPNLEGSNFKSGKNELNDFQYDQNKRYLHFFQDEYDAFCYLEENSNFKQDEAIVLAFHFDEKFLEAHKQKGYYHNHIQTNRSEDRVEYIMEADDYDPAENYIGIVDRDGYEKRKAESNKVHYDPDYYGPLF